jgi:hypothetical protein
VVHRKPSTGALSHLAAALSGRANSLGAPQHENAYVVNLQRGADRSSAPQSVDKAVNKRWIAAAYASQPRAYACFACRFVAPSLCMKFRLRCPIRATMLGVHQALEY